MHSLDIAVLVNGTLAGQSLHDDHSSLVGADGQSQTHVALGDLDLKRSVLQPLTLGNGAKGFGALHLFLKWVGGSIHLFSSLVIIRGRFFAFYDRHRWCTLGLLYGVLDGRRRRCGGQRGRSLVPVLVLILAFPRLFDGGRQGVGATSAFGEGVRIGERERRGSPAGPETVRASRLQRFGIPGEEAGLERGRLSSAVILRRAHTGDPLGRWEESFF